MITQISYFMIAIAALGHLIIGALFYSPLLFGTIWSKEMNTMGNKPTFLNFAGEYLVGLILAYFLSIFMLSCSTFTYFQVALWAWLGFIVPVRISSIIWANQSVKAAAIDVSAIFISMLAMAIILNW